MKAFEWYEKSAKQNYGDAQNRLGDLYKNGTGVEKKYRKSIWMVWKGSKKWKQNCII